MRIRMLALCAVLICTFGSARAEFPEKVKAVVEKTAMEVCSIIVLYGSFVTNEPNPLPERSIIHCGNAFQISASKVLSVAHVFGDIDHILRTQFHNDLYIRKQGRTVVGGYPERVDRIDFYRRVIASDGKEYRSSSTITYTANWQGPFTRESVTNFLMSIRTRSEAPQVSYSRYRVLGRDFIHDLALIELLDPITRDVYVKVENFVPAIGSRAWGYSLRPSIFGGLRRKILMNDGIVAVKFSDLGLTLETRTRNYPGESGSATVDDSARLVGVVYAISTPEYWWNSREVYPCDKEKCQRYVVKPSVIIEFLKKYN